jgi:NRAMP (natural resistance-associated macrophage protein)-like metal ion transporter
MANDSLTPASKLPMGALNQRLEDVWRRMQRPRGHPRALPDTGRWLRILGPGLITGAADDDPSGIGTYSQAGAAFGMGLLWMALYMLPLMIAVQEMCGRIGLVTGKGIASIVKTHYSRRALRLSVTLLLLANTINIGADLGAMAASTRLLLPSVPFYPLLIALALGMILVEVYVPYQAYARVLKVLALALLAYIVTGIALHPQWGPLIAATLIPQIQFTPAYLALVVAMLGTTISPYLFFWQASEEVEETDLQQAQMSKATARRTPAALLQRLKDLRLDTSLGMIASQVTTWFIIMTASSTLHAHGIINIQTADQAAATIPALLDVTRKAMAEVRLAVSEWREDEGRLGLVALQGLIAQTRAHSGAAISFSQDGCDSDWPVELSVALYRILQEALTNVMRHAAATAVTVEVRECEQSIMLTVADNGRYVADEPIMPGFGLKGIDERSQALGGSYALSQTQPHGLTLQVTAPIHTVGDAGTGARETKRAPLSIVAHI